jgi:hypothetical protein
MEMHNLALVAAALLLTLIMLRRRQARPPPAAPRRSEQEDNPDTVAQWPPQSVRVMTIAERQSWELLQRALPGFLVLAQVPLARFVKVPTRHSYSEWLQRVGSLSADLLVCDSGSKVLAVIDVRAADETERSRRRHERLARVLKAAGVKVYTWREDQLPTPSQVRNLIGAALLKGQPAAVVRAQPIHSRPIPLIPVAEIEELLAEGDQRYGAAEAADASQEPVPSGFFDDLVSDSRAGATAGTAGR